MENSEQLKGLTNLQAALLYGQQGAKNQFVNCAMRVVCYDNFG